MKKLFGKKGFTLIELVLVMVLLAALAAVIYPKYLDLRDDAHKAQDQAIIGALKSGIHIYFARHQKFPPNASALQGSIDGDVPTGWSFTDQTDETVLIQCDGLPSKPSEKATWTYDPDTGTITPGTQHPSD